MKRKLLIVPVLAATVAFSCKKDATPVVPPKVVKATADIVVPAGFTWQSSRNVNFTVNITDAAFPALVHTISIYDGDPGDSGNLLSKGSATVSAAYQSKIYLSNQIADVYVTAAFPDGSKITQKVPVGKGDVSVTIKQ